MDEAALVLKEDPPYNLIIHLRLTVFSDEPNLAREGRCLADARVHVGEALDPLSSGGGFNAMDQQVIVVRPHGAL